MAEKLKKKSKEKPPEQDSPWKGRITRMKKYRDKAMTNWERNRRALAGEESPDKKENIYNYAWGLTKGLTSAIYVKNPDMAVEPYDGSLQTLGMSMGNFLTRIANYDIDQMNIKAIGNIGVTDNFINGFFACIETIETEKETVRYPSGEEDQRLAAQQFCGHRIPPKDLLVDPKCRLLDLSDADYIGVYFYPTIASLKTDKTYKLPSDIDDYPEASAEKPPAPKRGETPGGLDSTSQGEQDPEYKTIAVIEIHDKIGKEIIYITDHKMQEIGRIPWPVEYKIGGRELFPVTLMAFNLVPDRFWPKPEIDLIYPQLRSLNLLDQAIETDALEKWRVLATIGGVLTKDQQAQITEPKGSNILIEINQDDVKELASNLGIQPHDYPNIRDLIVALQDPAVKKDMLAVREMKKQEIMDIVGYGPPERGGMPRTRSAREAVALKERIEAPLALRVDAVQDFYRLFGQKHLMAVQQKAIGDRYVRVFNDSANLIEYQKYSRDDIKSGTFNFIVYAGTSMPRNTEAKRNMELQIFTTMMPFAEKGLIPWQPVVARFAEAMGWKGTNELMRNPVPVAMELAKQLFALNAGPTNPKDQATALSTAAMLIQLVLTPEQLQMVAKSIQGQGQGSPPSSAPQGQRGESDRSRMEVGGVS